MAKYNSLAELFTAIADAIRAKKGGEDTIVAEDFPTEIEGILTTDTKITSISSGADSVGDRSFYQCMILNRVSFPLATSIGDDAFFWCSSLQTVDFPLVTSIGKYAFYMCHSYLQTVDFPLVTSIGNGAFNSCGKLKTFILRSDTMCILEGPWVFDGCYHFTGEAMGDNLDGLKDGYFYVPESLVETYKANSLWSKYSTQFRALEDYTVDGTTTGALDESKI